MNVSNPAQRDFHDIDTLLQHTRDLHAVPALCAALVVGDEVAALAASGVADLESGLPADKEHVTRWYSISKPLTTLIVLSAAEAGRLDLDLPVSRLLPGFRFAGSASQEHASLRDCLLHRSGFTGGNWTWDGAPPDPAALVNLAHHFPCPHPPGEGFHYQNLNFAILMEALASVGVDWHAAIGELLGPLGVKALTRTASLLERPRLAPHGPNGFGPAQRTMDTHTDGIAAAGGLSGTIGELACVAGMMAAGRGRWRGTEIVSRSCWEMATAPLSRIGDPPERERRNAWRSMAGTWCTYHGHRILTWAGGHRGHTSVVMAVPELRIAACALGNRGYSPAPEAACLSLLDRAAGWEPLPWPERTTAHKQRQRDAAAKRQEKSRSMLVAPWPLAPDTYPGVFHHPGYGDLEIILKNGEPHLRFRWLELPIFPREDGSFSALGSDDGNEIHWELKASIKRDTVTAWHFNPDSAEHPVRFKRQP